MDAVNGPLHLRENPESVTQVAASDTIFVTKGDLTDEPAVEELSNNLGRITPSTRVLSSFPPKATSIFEKRSLSSLAYSPPPQASELSGEPHASHGAERGGIRTLLLTFDEPLDWTAFGVWLFALLYAHGESVLRVKGLLDTVAPGPVSINGVQHVIRPPQHLDRWPAEVNSANERRGRRSHLVFIIRGLDPAALEASLRAFQSVPEALEEAL